MSKEHKKGLSTDQFLDFWNSNWLKMKKLELKETRLGCE